MTDNVAYLGIEGLDDLLSAGLSYDTQIMLQGDTGIGKSVFAVHFIYEGLMVGDTCVYIACDDVPGAMRQALKMYRLGSLTYEEAGRLIFVDAYSHAKSDEKYWVTNPNALDEFYLFERELLEGLRGKKIRLVVDSISTLFIQNDPNAYLSFNINRLKLLRRFNVLTLDSYVASVLDQRAMSALAHAYPTIIRMEFQPVPGGLRRIIQLGKMKSGEFQASKLPFTVDPDTGIMIYGGDRL
jgi:KaiC/GvpD/RAD55 family RecA-like ATPase